MFKEKEVRSHLTVTIVYFLIITILRFKLDWSILFLWFGAFVGTFFLDIDHLIYWFVTHPEKNDSIEAKRILDLRNLRLLGREGKTMKLFQLGQETHNTHTLLIFHSVVGQIILFILAIFVLTSGGSIFGSAFIMAINLHLLKDEWADYRKDKNHLSDWLFWQIREPKAKLYLNEYLIVVTLLFLIFSGLISR